MHSPSSQPWASTYSAVHKRYASSLCDIMPVHVRGLTVSYDPGNLGLDYAGKTTILYRLQLGKVVTTIPTIGFSVETINYRNLSLTAWDLCTQERMRPLWQYCACATPLRLAPCFPRGSRH
jgi:hypothetical protein